MGSGRTELAQAIFGVRPHESGSITIAGKPARIRRPWSAIGRGLGYLPESRKEEGLVMGLSVTQNVALASLKSRQRLGFITRNAGAIRGLRTPSPL